MYSYHCAYYTAIYSFNIVDALPEKLHIRYNVVYDVGLHISMCSCKFDGNIRTIYLISLCRKFLISFIISSWICQNGQLWTDL